MKGKPLRVEGHSVWQPLGAGFKGTVKMGKGNWTNGFGRKRWALLVEKRRPQHEESEALGWYRGRAEGKRKFQTPNWMQASMGGPANFNRKSISPVDEKPWRPWDIWIGWEPLEAQRQQDLDFKQHKTESDRGTGGMRKQGWLGEKWQRKNQ